MGSVQIPWTLTACAIGLLVMVVHANGASDLYSNSFISPSSMDIGWRLERPIQSGLIESTNGPGQEPEEKIKGTPVVNERVQRSAEPILSKTTPGDDLLLHKNIEDTLDTNDVELSGRLGHFIQPSRTDRNLYIGGLPFTSGPASGEASGALQGRSLQEPQTIAATATTTSSATLSANPGKARQANPGDIYDIITGIKKLLNVKVNVHANTAPGTGRPPKPFTTRINNRGPPIITDVLALPPDFDVPAPPMGPMTTPAPYRFDLPPHNMSPKRPYTGGGNIPLSNHQNKRPGPLPGMSNADIVSFTSEKPMEDILTLDLGSQFPHSDHSERDQVGFEAANVDELELTTNGTQKGDESPEVTTGAFMENLDQETAAFERNKEKNPKPEKTTKVTLVTPTMQTDLSILNTPISLVTEEESSATETSKVEENVTIVPTSVSEVLSSTTASTSSATVSEATVPLLEASIQEGAPGASQDQPTSSLSSVATQELPLKASTAASKLLNASSTVTASGADEVTSSIFPHQSYRPRPGIVLDDTEYKPGASRQPIITRPPLSAIGDIFDVTVSAVQGPGEASAGQGRPYVIPVDIDNIHAQSDVITSPVGDEGFVSIDGKRTYLNLFGDNPEPTSVGAMGVKPSAPSKNQVVQGTSYVEPDKAKPNYGLVKPAQRRPSYTRPPLSQPPVRIDTCIVGDDSTCDVSQHEICRTETGVSACHCRPGTARRKHRDPCRKIVSVLLSLRVDRLYERRIVWTNELLEKSSESYEQLSYEAERALESAMSMTPFSDEYLGATVNNIYQGNRAQGQAGVFVNITLQLEENADTARPSVRGDIQKHLLGVIQRRSNNVGNSALWVDSPPGSVSSLQDLDECSSPELHDCHVQAECINIFGSFKCQCRDGFRDPWPDNKHRAGRHCEQCSAAHCNNRGECRYQSGLEVCTCTGNYYGSQCELDGEVLGVAIGASVAAIIIIGLTLVCLVMWSRKWSREQKAAVGSPVFGYMATVSNTVKTPVVGAPPYQLTLEDRLRWAQIADVMAQANHYAPEPGLGPTRPSSAMFGYPTLPMNSTLQRHPGSIYGGAGTLPPVPLPRLNLQAQLASKAASMQGMRPLDNSSSSEEEDKVDLLGRNFHVPRPKSRSNASIANQSGIYYDVDYDQNEIYKPSGIPMSTYGRAPFFRNS